jgi:thiosulfate dehydrogenase (quinone) large subunit
MATIPTPAAGAAHALDRALAVLLLRLALGLDILLHGVTRLFIGGLGAFVNSTAAQFQHTALPIWQVRAFATAIPFLEFAFGLLLIAGLALRWTLVAGAVLMLALEFGTAMRSDWTVLSSQLLYSFLYSVLLFCRAWDAYSLDALRRRQR